MVFSHPSFSWLFLFLSIAAIAQATVPPSQTFTYVNEGEFGEYNVEFGANYRLLDIRTYPFTLAFFNTTPNAFKLGLRMGANPSESVMRWVWEANRANPVRENATLRFGRDGNLVLADVDGKVAWQTGTANEGVVGLRLLPSGNLVLHDSRGRFVWQSFDFPTDTLVVGQHLRTQGPNKLVSRVSNSDGSEGPYSLVLEAKQLALYVKDPSSSKPLLYWTLDSFTDNFIELVFTSVPFKSEAFSYDELGFQYRIVNSSRASAMSIWARIKYNTTYSYFRLGSDGNVRIHTLYDRIDIGLWEVTYTLFNRDRGESECLLPKRCGSLGLCEDSQCVACPSPKGLLGWSSSCAPPKLPPCNGRSSVDYYKLVGVEHFLNQVSEGDGPMKLVECREKCSKDCKCLGFFYREESSKCLLAPILGTLTKVSNSSHVAFIKFSK